MTKSNLRGAGPNVETAKDFNTKKTSAEASEKRTKDAPLAKGGSDAKHRMFEEQQASPASPGRTSHNDIKGPGAPVAEGGKEHMAQFVGANPAIAGHVTQPTDVAGYRDVRRQKQAEDRFGSNDVPAAKPTADKRPSRSWFKGE